MDLLCNNNKFYSLVYKSVLKVFVNADFGLECRLKIKSR